MPHFDWNEEKNAWLKEIREVSFEDVVMAFREGKLADVIDHPNQRNIRDRKLCL